MSLSIPQYTHSIELHCKHRQSDGELLVFVTTKFSEPSSTPRQSTLPLDHRHHLLGNDTHPRPSATSSYRPQTLTLNTDTSRNLCGRFWCSWSPQSCTPALQYPYMRTFWSYVRTYVLTYSVYMLGVQVLMPRF